MLTPPTVHTDKAPSLVQDNWNEILLILVDNLMKILTICVQTIYFQVGSNIYQQEEDLAMGASLSVVMTNIYLE